MQLALWQLLVLAVVQGVTEFLPVSSSGHLVILSALMLGGNTEELDNLVEVNIVLHLGTLCSILVYYWHRIWRLLGEDRRVAGQLILGTLPAVVVGLPLRLFAKEWLSDPLIAGCLLPVTGVILLLASRWKETVGDYRTMTPWQAIKIGLAQACAILPGLSRSGTTIAAGLMTGLSPRSAATFSFLLALPAIAGAGVLELIAMPREETSGTPVSYLLLAATVSFIVGLAAIAGLVRLLERGKLHWFAWWCIPAGLAVIAMYWHR